MELIKDADVDKYKCISYEIEFDSRSRFLFTDRGFGKDIIIFGGNMSSSVHFDNNGKDFLILGEGPTEQQDDTTLTADA